MTYFFVLITWTIVFWNYPALSLLVCFVLLTTSPDYHDDPLLDSLSCTSGLSCTRRPNLDLVWSHSCWVVAQDPRLAPLAAPLPVHSLVQGLLCCLGAVLPRGSLLPPGAPQDFAAEFFLAGWPQSVLLQGGSRLFPIPEARLCLGLRWTTWEPVFHFTLNNSPALQLTDRSPQPGVTHKVSGSAFLSHHLGC